MVTKFKPSLLGSRGGGFAVVVQQLLLCLEDVMKHLRLCRNEGLRQVSCWEVVAVVGCYH
jgi:hypothetical protein